LITGGGGSDSRYIYRKKSFAMAAFEAGFMIRYPFKRHHINHIDSLITSLAFIQSSCECHSFLLLLLLLLFSFFFFSQFFLRQICETWKALEDEDEDVFFCSSSGCLRIKGKLNRKAPSSLPVPQTNRSEQSL
jgi:hypothetical protein